MILAGLCSRKDWRLVTSWSHRHSDAILTHLPSLRRDRKRLVIILRSLGSAEIETAVTTLTPSQEVVFAAALYMVMERGKRVSRTRLASLLWPSVPEKARAHRLRQTVLQLKKLGVRLVADRDNLQLAKQDARSDADDLALNHPALSTPQSSLEFLPGYTPRLSEELRDWVDAKRTEVHAAATSTLVHDLERARLRADWTAVEKCAAACLALDAYNETAILAQAEAAAMRGGKRKAMSILDQYIAEVGIPRSELQLPAALLRRRVVERIPDRHTLLNPDPPFVGRETEIETLTRRLEEARRGRGSATLVIGEPGIGKSRLSAELARFAELQGAQVERATCRRTDADHPLSLFVDIVPQLREMPGALGCAPESFAVLRRLTDFEEQTHLSRRPDSEVLFQDLRTALFDLIASVTDERCLVVVVEDIQWLDVASGKILGAMVEQCSTKRLLFLFNCRPGRNTVLDYIEKSPLQTLILGPLDTSASVALLHSVALRPGDQPAADFVNWCLPVAEGNPFFLQELAHQWIETGQRYEVPPSVTKVLDERLSRLTPEALQILQACAVLGEHSTLERVESLLGYRAHQVLFAIEELSEAAMLAYSSGNADIGVDHLQPRHDYLSSAAMNRLRGASLSFLHRRAADILEKAISQSSAPAALLWACAGHRHQAGDRKRALALRLSCAQHLLGVGLTEEACRRYNDSLAWCTSDEDRLSVLSPLSVAHQLNGEWELSKQALSTCVRIAANSGADVHSEFEIALFQARARSNPNFMTLLGDVMPCVKSAKASPQHRVNAAIIALKVASDVGPSNMLDTIYYEVQPFLALPTIEAVSALEIEIIYQTMRSSDPLNTELLERFAALTRERHGEIAYSHALMLCASACRIANRDDAGTAFTDAAVAHAIDRKLVARIPVINLSRIRAHAANEDWKSARVVLSSQTSHPIAKDDANTRADWDFFEARVAFEEGDLAQAESAMIRVEALSGGFSTGRTAGCLALAVRLRVARGAGTEFLRTLVERLESAHRITRDIGLQDFEAYALFAGLARIGDEERGFLLLNEYVDTYRHSRRELSSDIKRAVSRQAGSLA